MVHKNKGTGEHLLSPYLFRNWKLIHPRRPLGIGVRVEGIQPFGPS